MKQLNQDAASAPAPAAPARGRVRLLDFGVRLEAGERGAMWLAFACNFVLLGDYYVLRPLRDTMATFFDVSQLNYLFMGTFALTLLGAPLYAALAARFRLAQLLPALFWFWLSNILLFALLLRAAPGSRLVAGCYFVWFSVINLYLISIFWTLMVELFDAAQATRLFAFIAAGGSIGAIIGPLVTRSLVQRVGHEGLLLIAAAGFVLVIVLVKLLIRAKQRLQRQGVSAQRSTMDHALPGTALDGFRQLFARPYLQQQALFILLMTWVATISYFLQTEVIARGLASVAERTVAIADIDLMVNVATALVLILGVGRFVRRFGLTATLVLNPLVMVGTFAALVFAPTVFMVQLLQVVRRVTQYAVARPSREICFAVLDQETRYKAKNVIDTTVYRFGDVSASMLQAGLRALGSGLLTVLTAGVAASALWGWAALALGRRYESLRRDQSQALE
jgi:AAA family ATP:ADP antiporter